jgi:hypothetical protein
MNTVSSFCVDLCFLFSEHRIVLCYANFVLNLLRKFQIVFQSDSYILYSHKKYIRVPISPNLWQYPLFPAFDPSPPGGGCEVTFPSCFDLHSPDG